ncbi:MAG TPA: DinB family protein [Bryobacteraceae bacterium]|nr:DinB family protein [Bryobacteraceae bacterium]
MKDQKALREHLLNPLTGESAHASFESAVKDVPSAIRGTRPKGAAHSPWEVLEHLRITQWDILEFTRDPKHVSPDFPAGYWPAAEAPPDGQAWDRSVAAFRADLKAIAELIAKESTDLLAPLAHAPDKTILREVLLVADHNAYHLGELVLLRRVLGGWQ